jgi:hypothetical protein
MRGLAVVVMIQCHVFNSFARMDVRSGGPFVLSQFIGGMAAPLFLFMAGMTFAFQMESLEKREPARWRRWGISLRRSAYILGIAFLFRFTNWAGSYPHWHAEELTKVDILNCMGIAMAAFSAAALFRARDRIRFAVALALAIACLSPVAANLNWGFTPSLVREYLVPGGPRIHFAFFPCASYVGFGLAAGTLVRRAPEGSLERLMQWLVLIGFPLIFCGQYFSNIPFSIYSKSNFWTDSPALILIRLGILLLALAGSYVWTAFCFPTGWSWMQVLGKNSLMVYWVHVMLVYGGWVKPLKATFSIPLTVLAAVVVTAMMIALTVLWHWFKARRTSRLKGVAGDRLLSSA